MYTESDGLPFRKILSIDFEYCGADGELPKVVCMVTQDLRSGEVSRYWRDDLCKMKAPRLKRGRMLL